MLISHDTYLYGIAPPILLEQAAFNFRYLPEIMLSHSCNLRIEFEVYIF
jgi:hypothetical protein